MLGRKIQNKNKKVSKSLLSDFTTLQQILGKDIGTFVFLPLYYILPADIK